MAEVPGVAEPSLENVEDMAVGQTPGTGAAKEVSSNSTCEEGDTAPAPGSADQPTPVEGSAAVTAGGTVSLLMMEEKFSAGQYRAIDQFVADFRSMLEGCYQLHGADHWLSKQAQKLEMMLEQKLALLPRNLRERTLSAATSKSLCGAEEDKASECTLTRRRSSSRSLASVNTGAMESVMVQVLKQAEFLRAKEEKRLKEQERKEAEEASQKEMEEWDRNLLALAAPSCMETMWEIPAIGHFLCLAQQILNLPEIVFYELERCLLMPQCNVFLSKIMTSLLSPPHRRPTLHRRPNLSYRAWEAALRQKVQQWYTSTGQAENPEKCAEKLGLCSQFFRVLGEVNPLEQKAFHELTFHQKVWLLKGICDFVYETQIEVQDAVLGQPIHECREVILGYDSQENAYIHFPQFCGADVRVYKQRPLKAPEFPIPPIKIKRIPKARYSKSKRKYPRKNNGQPVLSPTPSTNVELQATSSENYTDSSVNCTKHDIKTVWQNEDQNSCDKNKPAFCKENIEKPSSPGELIGYGEPLSPGEIRILENVDRYADITLPKTDTSPLKENALKTFQVHMNGNHTNNTEVICHRVAMDIILDHSALNHEELRLRKLRAKKKKKKRKMKDLLAKNAQGRCESLQNTFKSFKTEMHNKLFLNKKRAKHKKHKSAKKPNMIVKKRKCIVASSATPEFQLVCSNLDELRELIKNIHEELKSLENNKKKSGKWHLRRQGVKELHGTLTRLLNELLPWEPKLLKAFQRNRVRLRKDFDELQKLSESENFTRESSSRGGCDPNKPPTSAKLKSSEHCHEEIKKKECHDEFEPAKTDGNGKGKTPKKEYIQSYLTKSQTRNSKRLFRTVDDEDKGMLAQKQIKLNTPEISSTSTEGEPPANNCGSSDQKKYEVGVLKVSTGPTCSSPISLYKGPNVTEALLANIGNKLTLTQNINNTVPCSESTSSSATDPHTVKSTFSCQSPLKAPLQMIYKLPDGQCVPVDLQSSSVKIQMQPVVDAKTGDKLMQQVLILPKNIFIQQKDDRTPQVTPPAQSDVAYQHCTFNVPLSCSTTGQTSFQASPLAISKNISCSTNCATLTLPPVSTFANSSSIAACETSKISAQNFLASVVPSSYRQPVPITSDFGRVTSSTGNAAVAIQTSKLPLVPQREIPEAKQELKTVCIRDSQSILVRTRGGNTGVVKVQTSQGQGTPCISPSPIFTFTPQLQSFLVSKTQPSAMSSLPSVTTSPTQSTISTASLGINQVTESNTNWAQVHPYASKVPMQTAAIPAQPNILPTFTQAKTCPPTSSFINTAAGTLTPLSCPTTRQDYSVIRKVGTDLKQVETKAANVVQPDSTTPSKSDFVSGSSIHQVMLLTSPSSHPSGTPPNVGIVAPPTLAQMPSKKFVFINTQLPVSSSSTTMAFPSSKQVTSTNIGKTYVRPPEQPQVYLIPSTFGSPTKMSSPPIVSQVKDVKIGLTIGQTIVNNTAAIKNILPFKILQNPLGKVDEGTRKDPVSVATALSKVHNDQVTSSNNTCDYAVASTKGPGACSVVTSPNSVQYSAKGNEDFLRSLSTVSCRLPTSSLGNTVAISTVKTGHLSSSVLLSTNPMIDQTKHVSSLLQRPVSTTVLGTTSALGATSISSTCPPEPMKQSENNLSVSQSMHKVASTNVTKLPTTMSSSLVPTMCKTRPWNASSNALPTLPASFINQARPQLNESSTHHKLIINTSTPLAPGTQITINGTRFIVPTQGLGVGSHVLLLTTSAKQGPSLIGNAQECIGSTLVSTTAPQPALKQNISSTQYQVQSFNCAAAPDISKALSNVQPAAQILNTTTSNDFSASSLFSVNKPLSTTALQPLLVPCIQRGNYPLQTNLVPLSKGTPVTEGVMLSTSGTLTPTSAMLETKRAETDTFRHQSSTTDKVHSVAT